MSRRGGNCLSGRRLPFKWKFWLANLTPHLTLKTLQMKRGDFLIENDDFLNGRFSLSFTSKLSLLLVLLQAGQVSSA